MRDVFEKPRQTNGVVVPHLGAVFRDNRPVTDRPVHEVRQSGRPSPKGEVKGTCVSTHV